MTANPDPLDKFRADLQMENSRLRVLYSDLQARDGRWKWALGVPLVLALAALAGGYLTSWRMGCL